MQNKNKLLIIGSIPPPIGGVTIHVSRLMEHLDKEKFPYSFVDYKRNNVLKVFKEIIYHQAVHIHVSNVYLLFAVIFFARVLNKKIIFTKHGNINTNAISFFKNKLLAFCFKLANIPIVLNNSTLSFALKFNKNTVKKSSFLPPLKEKSLSIELIKDIEEDKKKYKELFATNAFKFIVDKQNKDIYGILELISLFRCFPTYKLYISNPTGDYEKYIKEKNIEISKNIQFISYPHSFFEILKNSDAMIRNTTTDGDAISIKEALYLNKKVFATNIVSRPRGVYLFDNIQKLEKLICNFGILPILEKEKNLNGFVDIINLYKIL